MPINSELQKEIESNRQVHILRFMNLMEEDPDTVNYDSYHLEELLNKVVHKDGSIVEGLNNALENYLK